MCALIVRLPVCWCVCVCLVGALFMHGCRASFALSLRISISKSQESRPTPHRGFFATAYSKNFCSKSKACPPRSGGLSAFPSPRGDRGIHTRTINHKPPDAPGTNNAHTRRRRPRLTPAQTEPKKIEYRVREFAQAEYALENTRYYSPSV